MYDVAMSSLGSRFGSEVSTTYETPTKGHYNRKGLWQYLFVALVAFVNVSISCSGIYLFAVKGYVAKGLRDIYEFC